MIYAVVNPKGGVGKTPTAVHLAPMLARTGETLLIDGDPQASAASWRHGDVTMAHTVRVRQQPASLAKRSFQKGSSLRPNTTML